MTSGGRPVPAERVARLTPASRRAWTAILDHVRRVGATPTLRELAAETGVRSPGGVLELLRRLAAVGLVHLADGRRRGFRLAGAACSACGGTGRRLPEVAP